MGALSRPGELMVFSFRSVEVAIEILVRFYGLSGFLLSFLGWDPVGALAGFEAASPSSGNNVGGGFVCESSV